ncbi:MAG: hypothetical protein ABIK83_16500 [Candidatus Zixiibacteriota bacterium]
MGQSRLIARVMRAMCVLLSAILLFLLIRAYSDRGMLWLVPYLKWEFSTPIDREQIACPQDFVLAVVCPITAETDTIAMEQGLDSLAGVISNYTDSDSSIFRITFASRADSTRLKLLSDFCKSGLGEVEYLLRSEFDTAFDAGQMLDDDLDILKSFGWAKTVDSEVCFTVLRERPVSLRLDREICSSLSQLAAQGCYFDLSESDRHSTSRLTSVNSIYLVSTRLDDAGLYSDKCELVAGKLGRGRLLVIDSPLLIDWSDWRDVYVPFVDDGKLTPGILADSRRVNSWIRADVHVTGQPNWIFVKLVIDSLLNVEPASHLIASIDRMLEYLQRLPNDGQYRVHFVTAREMYNIARAAEAGMSGNADDFRDYLIKPYSTSSR